MVAASEVVQRLTGQYSGHKNERKIKDAVDSVGLDGASQRRCSEACCLHTPTVCMSMQKCAVLLEVKNAAVSRRMRVVSKHLCKIHEEITDSTHRTDCS